MYAYRVPFRTCIIIVIIIITIDAVITKLVNALLERAHLPTIRSRILVYKPYGATTYYSRFNYSENVE